MLGMSAHCPARDENDNGWDQIAFWLSRSRTTEPDTNQAGCPPNDAHRGVLKVVVAPGLAPSVLGKGVDAAPCGDDKAVEEFLASSCPSQPHLAHEEQDDEDDAICDESAAHDEVCQALACMVGSTEAQRGNASKHELNPGDDWQSFPHDSMSLDNHLPDCRVYALFEMKLEIDAHGDLGNEHEHDERHEFAMDVLFELSALVFMAEEVACDGQEGTEGLDGNVPFGAYYLI